MGSIPITNFSGFAFRKSLLKIVGINVNDLSKSLELEILSESSELVAFNPYFLDQDQYLVEEMKIKSVGTNNRKKD